MRDATIEAELDFEVLLQLMDREVGIDGQRELGVRVILLLKLERFARTGRR